MKLANFVTKLQDVLRPKHEETNNALRRRSGRRLNIPAEDVESIYRHHHKKVVRVEYTGPLKLICKGCHTPFLFSADGRGRLPDYHSDACKQKAYRKRKQRVERK